MAFVKFRILQMEIVGKRVPEILEIRFMITFLPYSGRAPLLSPHLGLGRKRGIYGIYKGSVDHGTANLGFDRSIGKP